MAADAGSASPGSASRSQPGVLGPVLTERVLAGLARLQAAGLRRTPARSDVLTVLITAGAHLTAPQVHARLRDADRPFDYDYSTVLHALQTLTEQGLAHILATGGVAAYGIADRPHHHAICSSCAQVTELDADQLAAIAAAAERATGFTLAPHGITLRGQCPRCTATGP
jgi:Fur family transcriptional regulator, ferric uptake regulator